MGTMENRGPGRRVFPFVWLAGLVLLLGIGTVSLLYTGQIFAPRFTRHPGLTWQRSLRFEAGTDRHIAFSDDGKFLAAAIRAETGAKINIWNTADGSVSHEWSAADWTPSAVALSPDAQYIACAFYRFGPGKKAWETNFLLLHRVGDIANTISIAKESAVGEDAVASLAFAPDGHALAILAPGTLRVWDIPSCREIILMKSETPGANSVVFSPDGKLLAAAMDTQVRILDLKARRWRTNLKHPYGVSSVAFSPDGTTLAAIVNDAPAMLWNVQTGDLKTSLPTGSNQAGFISFMKSGHKLVTFSTKLVERSTEGTLELWNPLGRPSKTDLIAPTAKVQSIAFCPANSLLATASAEDDHWIELWDLGDFIH